MPYTPPNFVDGTTPLNQTNMNALGTQYSEAMQSFNQDLLSAFVESGLVASRHNSYASTVLADTPLRYYRFDETSGTVALDSSGNGQNGTYVNSPTLNVAGALTGDPDTAITLAAASSQTVSVPNTGLPTGNSAITLECWFKFAANPAATQALIGYGKTPSTAHQDMYLYIDSSGRLNVDFQTGSAVTSAAVSTGAWHHAVATWDGTTLRLYLDGVSVGTPITPGAQSIAAGPICNVGALATGGNDYSGQVDEVAIYGSALSSTRVTAHYTNGTTATTQVDLTAGVIVPTQSDSTTRRRAVGSANFTTVTPSTTYYLYAQPDGTTYWNTANTPAANSLALAQVTTDGSGNVSVVTDKRSLNPTVLPNAIGQIKIPGLASIGGQATTGSYGAPVIVAQTLDTLIPDTTARFVLTFVAPANGFYRASVYFDINNGSSGQLITAYVQSTDPDDNSAHAQYLACVAGSVTVLGAAGANLVNGAYYCFPAVLYVKSGTTIYVEYQDHGGTPNDHVSALIERLA